MNAEPRALAAAILLAGEAAAAPLVRVAPEPVPTVIRGVAILRADGSVDGPMDVRLEGGRIAELGPAGTLSAATVVPGEGRTLLPGLIDVHVHLTSTDALPRRMRIPDPAYNLEALLWSGVTTALDPGADPADVARLADRVAAGKTAGPTLVTAGKPFAPDGGHPISSVRAVFPGPIVRVATRHIAHRISTPADVDAALAAQPGVPFAKVMLDEIPLGMPYVPQEALEHLRERTSDAGIPLLAHVGRPPDVTVALKLPVDAMIHAPYVGLLEPAQLDVLASLEIPVAPTLTAWDVSGRMATGSPVVHPFVDALRTPGVARDAERVVRRGRSKETLLDPWFLEVAGGAADRAANVRALVDAGVPLLVGSDAPLMGVPAGAGTHRELQLLREAGVSPVETLVAATWTNSRLFGDVRFGAVEVGWEADLLLVEGDPTEDPDAIGQIAHVWTDGRAVTRRPAPPAR